MFYYFITFWGKHRTTNYSLAKILLILSLNAICDIKFKSLIENY
uniref:Uncharacterized protein n=1 Tax=Anguilla anguilla TaxID=7936 RepID=A0A0E9WWV5_ANGAN